MPPPWKPPARMPPPPPPPRRANASSGTRLAVTKTSAATAARMYRSMMYLIQVWFLVVTILRFAMMFDHISHPAHGDFGYEGHPFLLTLAQRFVESLPSIGEFLEIRPALNE